MNEVAKGTMPFDSIRLDTDGEGRYRMYLAKDGKDMAWFDVPWPRHGKSWTLHDVTGEIRWTLSN